MILMQYETLFQIKIFLLHANADVNSCLNILVCSRIPNFSWGWWLYDFYGIKPVCIASVSLFCSLSTDLHARKNAYCSMGLCRTSQSILFLRVAKDTGFSLKYKALIGGRERTISYSKISFFPPPPPFGLSSPQNYLVSVVGIRSTREIPASGLLSLVTPKGIGGKILR